MAVAPGHIVGGDHRVDHRLLDRVDRRGVERIHPPPRHHLDGGDVGRARGAAGELRRRPSIVGHREGQEQVSGEQAADIEVYELDASGRLRRFIAAPEAVLRDRDDWLLTRVQAKMFSGDSVDVQSLDEYRLSSFLTSGQVALLQLPPDSLSLSDLWSYIRSLDERAQNSKAYALAFWQKVCLPVTTGAMVLLSLTFIFGSTRTRNASQRIFLGMLTGVVFHLANQVIGHLGLILSLPPILTTLLPVGCILVVALRLLRRAF